MKTLHVKNLFRKGIKQARKRGKDGSKIQHVVDCLVKDEPLPHNARPHKLSGEWDGFWECHIDGDWLLIYAYDDDSVTLHATGSHQDLFKKY